MQTKAFAAIAAGAAVVLFIPILLVTAMMGGFDEEDGVGGICGGAGAGIVSTTEADQTPADVATIYARYAGGLAPDPPAETAWRPLVPRMVVALQAAQAAGFSGETLVTAVALAGRESRFDPTAHVLDSDDDSYGLWQINMLGDMGPARRAANNLVDDSELLDPFTNARAARNLYQANATPFYHWGPYRDDPVLTHGAADWVAPVYVVAVEFGFIGAAGESVADTPPVPDDVLAAAAAELPAFDTFNGCEVGEGLQGPNCTGLKGSGTTFMGVANGQITHDMLTRSEWGYLQPAAAAAWAQLVDAAVADGFSRQDLAGWNDGPGAREGNYSNHTAGLALDVNSLSWTPTRRIAGEPLAVAYSFDGELYTWLRTNAHLYGWCNPAWARPLYLNGTAAGGKDASGNGRYLEQWHWEYVAGSASYLPADIRGLNGPHGLPQAVAQAA